MENAALSPALTNADHHRGPLSAPIQIVEFGDFQCSYCARAFLEVEKLLEEFGPQICFVFRHFPLTQLHPNAAFAALAAEAASEQNAFWEMHDALFENSNDLSPDTIFKLVKELHLDVEHFGSDLNRREIAERVEADLESGQASGIEGTPTFFVNGERFERGAADLRSAVRQLLKTGARAERPANL